MKIYEYIVVGSGCTGAMAAQTLVDAGVEVAMLDVGIENPAYKGSIPENKDFLTIRKTEPEQYKYLIGKNFEGVAWGDVGKGEQLTPGRRHIMQSVETLIPVKSHSFTPAESLGYGGLGIGWGVGCWSFSDNELSQAGLDVEKMQKSYNTISRRIGISATKDSASEYTLGKVSTFQPSPMMDENHESIYDHYQKKEASIAAAGFVMGRAPLAVITRNLDGRKKYAYKDLDFYSDDDQSAYRPWITVNALKTKSNFTYIGNQLVVRFKESHTFTSVFCLDTQTNKEIEFRCKKLILAPGVLGSARIALRSFNADSTVKLPLLCNPYSYIPCIQPKMLGKSTKAKKLGFAQLSLFLDETMDQSETAMASIYSYRSLMLFRLARQVPLNFGNARSILQYISSAIVIMGIHQPDRPSKNKYVQLIKDKTSPTNDALRIEYSLNDEEKANRARREKKYMRIMRRMHVYPLKKFDPGAGASIHYAGTLPFSTTEDAFTLAHNGRLHGTKTVFVADGSGFTFLPAKGLTFTLMANAHVVAENALNA